MEDFMQKWVDAPGTNGDYQVSDYGEVASLKFGRKHILKKNTAPNGYLFVALYIGSKKPKYVRVHRLVWEAFNGPIQEGLVVNHINEDKKDNRLSNLNLLTPSENVNWGTAKQRRAEKTINGKKSKTVVQFDLNGNFIQEWSSTMEIERQTGFANSNVGNCCRGDYKQAYGFIWKYKKGLE